MGGAERVAEVFTVTYRGRTYLLRWRPREAFASLAEGRYPYHVDAVAARPGRYYRHYFLFYPFAIEAMDLQRTIW